MEFIIGKREDVYKIMFLNNQLNNTHFSDNFLMIADKIWDEIENNKIKYFLAKKNEEIIGSCYLCVIPNLSHEGKSIGFIENVIVDSNYRRKGIGKKLMEMAIEYAENNNCYKVVLQSGMDREEAHKFYENIGFNGNSKKAFELRFNKNNLKPILD